MRVLIACEFSGIVRDAFIARGHDAWSCDLLPTEQPGPHLQCDVLSVLEHGWDMMIAHPPCTYLSWAGNVWLKQPGRLEARAKAFKFFMEIVNAPISRIAIENPKGYPCTAYRAPDQIIHPYHFGHPFHKATCLWLKGLPLLTHDNVEPPPPCRHDGKRNRHWVDCAGGGGETGRKIRSRTFLGIAAAMADQWGGMQQQQP